MNFFTVYLLIAVITALTAVATMYMPALQKAKAANISNTFTRNQWISAAVFFVIATITAPVFVFALFHTETFKKINDGFDKVFLEDTVAK